MRRFALPAIVLLSAVASGCTPGGYFSDRWADAKDIFTVSVGTGGGAKARVGPVQVGAFYNSDFAGLRGGTPFWVSSGFGNRASNISDMALPFPVPREIGHGICVLCFSWEDFDPWVPSLHAACDQATATRGKDYDAFFPYAPFLTISSAPHYYTQIEVAAGVGGTLRLGFNPGELLDFLLGWTTLDFYGDDLAARKEREETKKAKEKPPAVPSTPPSPAPLEPKP